MIDVVQTPFTNIQSCTIKDIQILLIQCKDANRIHIMATSNTYKKEYTPHSSFALPPIQTGSQHASHIKKVHHQIEQYIVKSIPTSSGWKNIFALKYRKNAKLGPPPKGFAGMMKANHFEDSQDPRINTKMKPVYHDSIQFLDSTNQPFRFLHATIPAVSSAYSDNELKSGWKVYNQRAEFKRMGVFKDDTWRATKINDGWHFCASYPSLLVVPGKVSDDLLRKVRTYRSINRIPVLTWLHPTNGACLFRSSQPHSGIMRNHLEEDSNLVRAYYETANTNKKLLIIDCRSFINSCANQLIGKGTENMNYYKFANLEFLGIANIHGMSASFQQLTRLCETPNHANWLSQLENTGWIGHIQAILTGTTLIVKHMEKYAAPVLVHCSDGWDRTAQLCSLSQLCLDPYYRTFHGFQVLIEKDWISFGHKFGERLGVFEKSDQNSPVFLQFLDCVHYLLEQCPQAFEFNQDYLLAILDAAHSGLYGNFLVDNDQQRDARDLSSRTVSIWTYMSRNKSLFINELYLPTPFLGAEFSNMPSVPDRVLVPDTSQKTLVMNFWQSLYFRHQRSRVHSPYRYIRERNISLQAEGRFLSQELSLAQRANRTFQRQLDGYRELLDKLQLEHNFVIPPEEIDRIDSLEHSQVDLNHSLSSTMRFSQHEMDQSIKLSGNLRHVKFKLNYLSSTHVN